MNLSEIIRDLLNQPKKIDVKKLPTQGIFYKKDFELKIKKADMEDIIEYEINYEPENIYVIIDSLMKIVKNNVVLSKGYSFADIKSVDMVYIFLEIVKFTLNKSIQIPFYNEKIAKPDYIEFDASNFNYFDFTPFKDRDLETAEILIDGYRFSMPSIGVESSLTYFIASKKNQKKWTGLNYDFTFFVNNKTNLTFSEIENLVTIFNDDIDDKERNIIKNIKEQFTDLVGYSLRLDGSVIEIKSKLDLETIWK
jgi:hypothetical protein